MSTKDYTMSELPNKSLSWNGKIAIVSAEFNLDITKLLVQGAISTLQKYNLSDIKELWVPGCYEIPIVCQRLLMASEVIGIIAIGAIIQGETPHFDYISKEVLHSINRLSLNYSSPITLGILTTYTWQQAKDRTGKKYNNKGAEAAEALVKTLNVLYTNKLEKKL